MLKHNSVSFRVLALGYSNFISLGFPVLFIGLFIQALIVAHSQNILSNKISRNNFFDDDSHLFNFKQISNLSQVG